MSDFYTPCERRTPPCPQTSNVTAAVIVATKKAKRELPQESPEPHLFFIHSHTQEITSGHACLTHSIHRLEAKGGGGDDGRVQGQAVRSAP